MQLLKTELWDSHHPLNFIAVICMFMLLLVPQWGFAQTASQQTEEAVKVGLYESPPFVMPDAGSKPQGMSIDIWEKLADRLNLESDYVVYPTLSELRGATERGEVGVAVTNMTITQERAKVVDFTQPWFDAGMRIMVNETADTGLHAVVRGLQSAGYLRAYGWLAVVIVLSTLALTLFDRRFDAEFPSRWRDGIAESFYSVMSVATTGRVPSRKNLFGWLGRIWSALWLVCGIGVLAYVTSSVTSVMTTLAITGGISGPGDLPGRTIGVFQGSVGEQFATTMRLDKRSYSGINEAAIALENGRISAIVGDAPVLEYYVQSNPEKEYDVVGPIFEPDKYAFALQLGSPLTKRITVELLGLKEDGTINQLKRNYFGDAW
jgi:ABC-type amino acid transport substrate-binding protein